MKVSKEILKNGVRLLLVDIPDATSVSAGFFVKAGSRYEKRKNEGISHFVEHCLFKGSKKFPTAESVAFNLEGLGAMIDAGTSQEYTYYLVKVIKENFQRVFEIIADVFINPLFLEKEVSSEKKVIMEEIRMYEDNPMSKIVYLFTENLWNKQSIGRKISGTITSVKKISAEDLKKYKDQYYDSESVLIVIAGDLSGIKNIESFVEDKIVDLPKGKVNDFTKAKETLSDDRSVWRVDDVEQTHMILGTYGVSLNDERKFSAAVGNTILGQGFSSKLFRKIRGEHGLAYYVNSGNLSYQDTGSLYIRAGVDSKRLPSAMEQIVNVINGMLKGSIEDSEVDRAKQMLKASLVMDLDSTDSLGMYLGLQELLVKTPLSIEQLKLKIDKVTKDEILKTLTDIFSKPKLLTLISPAKEESSVLGMASSIGKL